ncbi:pilus assembly protein [Paenarthrobacter sp. AR 02]|uniref:TadE family type IV pilus minor pilin n=1 Tax=Paenarthrobacter sp. AR 02 TaxID=2899821 RepID=UPI001F380B7F|nr:TadE family type IV pilus minor pilin [Paenarthrobacter sp. AR 02]MCF3138104.1 pilus assembly protein [Paenarthrobacter sp. AR 02]
MTPVLPACRSELRWGKQQGAVTAEFAVALPAVVLLLAFLLAGGAAGVTQVRLEEAVRAGARASARGESPGSVETIVKRLAGEAAVPGLSEEGGWCRVTATSPVGGALGYLIPWNLKASASARTESVSQ